MRWDFTELRRAAIAAILVAIIGASWSAASAADKVSERLGSPYFSAAAHADLTNSDGWLIIFGVGGAFDEFPLETEGYGP